MKYLFFPLFGLVLVLPWLVAAQSPRPTFRFSGDVEEELQQQFSTLFYRANCAIDTLSGVVVSIRISPMQEGTIDGIERLHTASFQLYMESRISGSQRILAAEVAQVMSTGVSKESAQRAALLQLQQGTPQLNRSIEQLAASYRETFSGSCHALLADATKLANNGALLAAVALTDAVPADAHCYEDAQRERIRFYNQYQVAHCAEHLGEARTKLSLQQPQAVLDALGKIDPQSSCAREARQVLEAAAAQLQEQQLAKARFLRQVYQNQVQVEQARNQIIADLVKE